MFYDNGKNVITAYRVVEAENILISDAKAFNNNYLLLAGEYKGTTPSAALIGYEIKNGRLLYNELIDSYSDTDFEVAAVTLLENKNLSPASCISSKDPVIRKASRFRGFTEDGFDIVLSKAVKFSFDAGKKCFAVKSTEDVQDWSKQKVIVLYKNKFFKDKPASEFPDNVEFE